MRLDSLNVKITLPIPIGTPDKNGVIYAKEAIENAVSNFQYSPIIYRDENSTDGGKVVGAITDSPHVVVWDDENQVCNVTVDGKIFFGGADIIVNAIENGTIVDFDIMSIGISQ